MQVVGTVTSVSGTSPISVINGTSTPAISISAATTSAAGTMSSSDKTKLDGIDGNLVDEANPELGGDLDVNGHTIIDTSNTNANIKLAPNGDGVVEIRGNSSGSGEVAKLQLNCHTNAHGVIIASPPHTAGASYTFTLPPMMVIIIKY